MYSRRWENKHLRLGKKKQTIQSRDQEKKKNSKQKNFKPNRETKNILALEEKRAWTVHRRGEEREMWRKRRWTVQIEGEVERGKKIWNEHSRKRERERERVHSRVIRVE